ncbi:hypothetical protein AU15_08215 [Marinobacter salarius]|uniref:Uncharacterized protein n=1 Tax=Marinobacter salarius TaxID=1420917 RepID=W5YV35_9GAMM|nr:hypothetical protein AU15_08215 [Marinobacter salarius]
MKLGFKLFPVILVLNKDEARADQGDAKCAGEQRKE